MRMQGEFGTKKKKMLEQDRGQTYESLCAHAKEVGFYSIEICG